MSNDKRVITKFIHRHRNAVAAILIILGFAIFFFGVAQIISEQKTDTKTETSTQATETPTSSTSSITAVAASVETQTETTIIPENDPTETAAVSSAETTTETTVPSSETTAVTTTVPTTSESTTVVTETTPSATSETTIPSTPPPTPEPTPPLPTVPAPIPPTEPIPPPTTKSVETTTPLSNTDTMENEVLSLVNAERANAGLSPLTRVSSLNNTAEIRASEQPSLFGHTRPNGEDCFTAFPSDFSIVGENVAKGQTSAAEVMKDWIASEGHKANILHASFTQIGIACYYSNNTYYWVQAFGG